MSIHSPPSPAMVGALSLVLEGASFALGFGAWGSELSMSDHQDRGLSTGGYDESRSNAGIDRPLPGSPANSDVPDLTDQIVPQSIIYLSKPHCRKCVAWIEMEMEGGCLRVARPKKATSR